jgi:hypothetical protein
MATLICIRFQLLNLVKAQAYFSLAECLFSLTELVFPDLQIYSASE